MSFDKPEIETVPTLEEADAEKEPTAIERITQAFDGIKSRIETTLEAMSPKLMDKAEEARLNAYLEQISAGIGEIIDGALPGEMTPEEEAILNNSLGQVAEVISGAVESMARECSPVMTHEEEETLNVILEKIAAEVRKRLGSFASGMMAALKG